MQTLVSAPKRKRFNPYSFIIFVVDHKHWFAFLLLAAISLTAAMTVSDWEYPTAVDVFFRIIPMFISMIGVVIYAMAGAITLADRLDSINWYRVRQNLADRRDNYGKIED